jgi:glycosyltransferase involved in cell wall biosynthesis
MIVPSRFVKDWLLRIGVSGGKIVVVESGLDQQFRTPLGLMIERSSLAMSESDLIVTYAGSPCTIRGSEIFVRAIQLLLATRRTALKCLVLSRRPVGNTCQHLRDEEAYLKRLIIKLGLEDVFRIIPGVLKREEYTAFMQASDIVVLPFKLLQCEIPLSVLEAMSLGKLVVTTRIRTLQEIAGENRALLIAPGDPYALTRAILDVIQNNHAARRIAAAGQKYAYSLPSWETVGDKTLSILRTAANAVQK